MNDIQLAKKYLSKQQSAKSRGIEFSLSFTSFKNLMRAKRCKYSGVLLTDPVGSHSKPTDRSIDRIDSSKGYVKGNVVAVSYQMNCIKGAIENKNEPVPLNGLENVIKVLKNCA